MKRSVRTSDGRTLAVEIYGDPDGKPVLVHMGTPNSRHLYPPNVSDAQARGLRLISYDRPGYGESTPAPGRSVADCADDVRSVCDALGVTRIAVWGISGGGPCALACAALLPDLVVAAASLASVAPFDAEGLDFFAGMGQLNVDDFRLLVSDPDAARVNLEREREEILSASAADLNDALQSLLTPTDAAVLKGPIADYLVHVNQEGLAPGLDGFFDDAVSHVRPWGFELSAITVPVLLLHGKQDRFVPFGHGEWIASRVPGVDARLSESDGHLTLLEHRVGEVHAWLDGYL